MTNSSKSIIFVLLTGVLMTVLMVLLLTSTVNSARTEVETRYQEMQSFVGDTVIINKDTLVITDFSTIDETFTLSNKVRIHKSFVIKNNKSK